MRVLLLSLILVLPACTGLGVQQANQEISQICSIEDVSYQCSVDRAYSVHDALTDQIRSGFKSGAISGETSRKLVESQKDALAFLDQADAVTTALEGQASLHQAQTVILYIQQVLIDSGAQL